MTVTNPYETRAMIRLHSGVELDILDPDYALVTVQDIAHGLAGEARYNAQSPIREWVAHHTRLLSTWARTMKGRRADGTWHPAIEPLIAQYGEPCWLTVALCCLFHDGPEAFTSDIVSPLKRLPCMAWFLVLEQTHTERMIARFELPALDSPVWHFVEALDKAIVTDEKLSLWPGKVVTTKAPETGLGVRVEGLSPEQAAKEWLAEYDVLMRELRPEQAPVLPKDALDRAMEMMQIPMGKIPEPALKYAAKLCGQLGMCMEVLITAYAAYAQAVEKLPCEDDAYYLHPVTEVEFWAAQTQYVRVDLPNGNMSFKRV